jgi:excisionase family DNA binding protein
MPTWITIDEAVQLLGGRVSRSTLYRAANDGRIPARRIGRRILVARSWLEPGPNDMGGPK